MGFRNISAWAIRNPIPPLVLFAALLLAGLVAFSRMPIQNNPDVEFPAVTVQIAQPGAAPSELETQVTQRVEAAVRGINGVDEINSSVREGGSFTFISFIIGTPVDRAVSDVRDAVSNIRGDLPEGILEPQVTRQDIAGGEPLGFFAAETSDMTLEELSWYVDNTVAKRLLSVSGVAAVERSGGVDREIRVVLDPAELQAFGITAAQVNAQLRQINLNAAGGRAEIAGAEQAVRVLGNAVDANALADTQIAVGGGRTVRLGDIATVRDDVAETRSAANINGRPVVGFSVQKAKGTSEVTVWDAARAELDELAKENPRVQFRLLNDNVQYTKEQYDSAMQAMIEGAVLAVLVVFLFLRDWRATLISAIAIPLSAIPAFFIMQMMGFTLNGLSLLALSLVAGVLVDDAIVEIENIVRHMRMGKTAYQASIDAADEIGLAVLATTMSIVAVFLPVALMPGISGEFFKNFGYPVVIAVLMSLAVARLITPLLAAYFLKAKGVASHGEGRLLDGYMAVLRWSLRWRWTTMGFGAASLALTVFLFMQLPITFQPKIDLDTSSVRIELPPGATHEQTRAVVNRAASILQEAPEVEAIYARSGVGNGNLNISLKEERELSSTDWERTWAPRLNAIPDARVTFNSQSGGFTGRDITISLGGDDPAKLLETANKIVAEMETLPELRAPRFTGDTQRPEIVVTPRLDLAADLGVTTAALGQTIRIATLGDIDQNSAKFSLSDRQIPIRVSLPEDARQDLSTLENLPVPTAAGGSVPLKSVAEIRFGAGPTTVQRTNQLRRATIGVDLAPGLVTGDVTPKIYALPTMANLPQGVQELKLGEAKWQLELFQNFIIAVVSGVLLVLAVLVLLYKRVMPPFVNLGSLLLAPLGAAIALNITGDALSMPVFIGLLMLLGIVAKNSILLIDFALEEMNKGVDKDVAIEDAGHKRAQPIVMTTVAMVAGMVPVALSLTGDGSFRAPMGVTVIGGLIVSTVLTLVIVPASFSIAMDFETWLGRKLGRLLPEQKVPETAGRGPIVQPAE